MEALLKKQNQDELRKTAEALVYCLTHRLFEDAYEHCMVLLWSINEHVTKDILYDWNLADMVIWASQLWKDIEKANWAGAYRISIGITYSLHRRLNKKLVDVESKINSLIKDLGED